MQIPSGKEQGAQTLARNPKALIIGHLKNDAVTSNAGGVSLQIETYTSSY